MMTPKEEALHVLKTYTRHDGTVEDKPSTRLAAAFLDEQDQARHWQNETERVSSLRDSHEARLVELFLAAFSGPVEIAADLSHEVARVVNAIRINARETERVKQELANAPAQEAYDAVCDALAAAQAREAKLRERLAVVLARWVPQGPGDHDEWDRCNDLLSRGKDGR